MSTFPRTRLSAELLEARCVPATISVSAGPSVVVGGTGGAAWVTRGDTTQELRPFGDSFAGTVNVASADVNGDGVNDVVAGAGEGGASRVVVRDGKTGAELRSFLAFDPAFTGGVGVAVGDINFDGYADVIAAVEGGGAPHVKVFDGKTGAEVRSFFAYDPSYTGGVRVAAADVSGDFRDDIVTAPAGAGGPNVRVFDGTNGTLLRSFFAYADGYTGGVSVAAADVDHDGVGDIITGSLAGSGHVKVFSGKTGAETESFFAFGPDQTGGVRVAAGLFNGDLTADIAVASVDSSQVRVLDGQTGAELADIPPQVGGGGSIGVGSAVLAVGSDPGPSVPNSPAAAV